MSTVSTCSQCKRSHPKVSKEDRDALLIKHLDLVERAAKKIHRSLPPSVALDDLISFGTFGLLRAIEHFDPNSGVHFETYAVSAIRGVIADELRSQDWVPRSLRKKQRNIALATKELERELLREPTLQEIATKLNLAPIEIESTRMAAVNAVHSSLDEQSGDSVSRYDLLPDTAENDPLVLVSHSEIFRVVAMNIMKFPLQEQMILLLYYHEMLTLRDISSILGISESRASQLHVRVALEVREQLKRLVGP